MKNERDIVLRLTLIGLALNIASIFIMCMGHPSGFTQDVSKRAPHQDVSQTVNCEDERELPEFTRAKYAELFNSQIV